MTDHGIVRGLSAALGFVVLGVVAGAAPTLAADAIGAAPALGAVWTGGYIGFKTDYVNLNIDYENTGTPEQNLSGAMLGLTAGYDVQFNNFVVGVAADGSIGNLNDFVRDGNYITESGKLDALGSVRGRVGVVMGEVMPYFTGGIMFGSLERGEVCPNPAAVVAGFCSPAAVPVHAPFNLKQKKIISGATVGGGVEVVIAQGWTMQAQYLHTFFQPATFVLSPDVSGNPLPPSIAKPTLDVGSVAFIKRF